MKPLTPNSRRGFTLLEIMAVMAIITFFVGVAMIRGDMVSPILQADKVAAEMGVHLRSARTRAIVEGKVVRLEIYPEDHLMLYYWEDPTAEWDEAAPDEEEPFAQQQWPESIILERAIIGADEAFNQQSVVLRFWPTGVCTPVRLHIRHATRAKVQRTVRLNPLTGLTKIIKGYETPEHYELKIKAPGRRM